MKVEAGHRAGRDLGLEDSEVEGAGGPLEKRVVTVETQVVWNSAVATGLGKVGFHPNPKERQRQEGSNCRTVALTSQGSKGMLKIL